MANIHVQHSGNGKAIAKNLNNRARIAMQETANENRPKRGRKLLSEDEKTPSGRFYRIAGVRGYRICKLIKSLEACVNADLYFYTDEQATMMIAKFRKSVDKLEKALLSPREDRKAPKVDKGNLFD